MTDQPASMNPSLKDFWMTRSRVKTLYGGRSSSKSWDAAANAIRIARFCKVRFLATRMFQNKIEDSVYSLLKIQIERFGLRHEFEIQKTKIVHLTTGSEFLFYGLARNIDEIKSLESIDICWCEEAHAMTKKMWEVLEPTIRKEGSEFWIVFNPQFVTDFAYQRFVVNPPKNSIVRKINYTENPFLTNTMMEVISGARAEDEDDFQHIYLGEPRSDDDKVIIKRSWIQAAVDAHIALGFDDSGSAVVGYDVADSGDDLCANVVAKGSVTYEAEEWKAAEDELNESCLRTYNKADEWKALINYDSIGVGAHSGSEFKSINEERYTGANEFKRLEYKKFNAGAGVINGDDEYQPGVTNRDFFENLKAQAWWTIADRFRNTYNAVHKGMEYKPEDLISISSDIKIVEKLITELSTPRRDFSKNGKVKVEGKQDLAKRDIASPNVADAFIMAHFRLTDDPQSFAFLPNRLM